MMHVRAEALPTTRPTPKIWRIGEHTGPVQPTSVHLVHRSVAEVAAGKKPRRLAEVEKA